MNIETSLMDRPAWYRFVLSTLIVAFALGLNELLWLLIDRPITSPLFLGAIVVVGWFCGWRWGLYTAILSAFVIDVFFVPPFYHFAGDFDEFARLSVFTLEGAIVCWLIEVRRRAVVETQKTQYELRALSSRQQTLREEEQKRIALEIHDELGQALTSVKMEVHLLSRSVDKEVGDVPKSLITEKLGDLTGQIDSAISTIRRIATELRPSVLDDFGLVAAMEWQAKEFERKSGLRCVIDSEFDSLDIEPEVSTAVFRIFQEALTNISRHAKAKRVAINIGSFEGNTTVTIADDGIGINLLSVGQKHSLGILGMRERARLIGAALDISNGNGTTIHLTLPRPNVGGGLDL